MWDLERSEILREFPLQNNGAVVVVVVLLVLLKASEVALSCDGTCLASVDERAAAVNSVRIYDVASCKELAVLAKNSNQVPAIRASAFLRDCSQFYCVCLSPDGQWIAAGGVNGLRIWPIPDWLVTIESPSLTLTLCVSPQLTSTAQPSEHSDVH